MRSRYALGLTVVLAACGGHAADVARTARTQSSTTPIESDAIESGALESDDRVATAPEADASPATVRTPSPTTAAESSDASNAPPDAGVPVDDEGGRLAPSPSPDLDAVVLHADDIPGWNAEPHAVPPTERATAECNQLSAVTRDRVAHAGRTFVSPDGERELSNEVSWYQSTQAAASVITTVDVPATVACLERLLTGEGDAFTVDSATVERRALSDGDLAVGYQADLAVTVGGGRYEFVVTIEYVQVAQAVTFAMSFAPDRVADEAGPAFDAVVRRLAAL